MEELTPLLEELAAQMNTTVEFLWGVLVRQAYVSAMGQIVFYALLIILVFILVYYVFPWLRAGYNAEMAKEFYDRKREGGFYAGMIAVSVVIILVIMGIFATVPLLITKFLNPEYWALQQIMEFIK